MAGRWYATVCSVVDHLGCRSPHGRGPRGRDMRRTHRSRLHPCWYVMTLFVTSGLLCSTHVGIFQGMDVSGGQGGTGRGGHPRLLHAPGIPQAPGTILAPLHTRAVWSPLCTPSRPSPAHVRAVGCASPQPNGTGPGPPFRCVPNRAEIPRPRKRRTPCLIPVGATCWPRTQRQQTPDGQRCAEAVPCPGLPPSGCLKRGSTCSARQRIAGARCSDVRPPRSI
jgi:hypothetical protein